MDGSVRDRTGHCGPTAVAVAIIGPIAGWYILFHVGQPHLGGSSSVAERQLPKLNVAGSIPVSRSNHFNDLEAAEWRFSCFSTR